MKDLFGGKAGYRLGDVACRREARDNASDQHISRWPHSIASAYLNQTQSLTRGEQLRNVPVLAEVSRRFARRNRVPGPARRVLIMHLRLGDSLDYPAGKTGAPTHPHYSWPVERILATGQGCGLLRSYEYYKRAASQAKANGVEKVVLVGASHMRLRSYDRSMQYVRKVESCVKQLGLTTQRRLGGDPDRDFCFMSKASYFCGSGGFYSSLVAEVVRENGGVTLPYISETGPPST